MNLPCKTNWFFRVCREFRGQQFDFCTFLLCIPRILWLKVRFFALPFVFRGFRAPRAFCTPPFRGEQFLRVGSVYFVVKDLSFALPFCVFRVFSGY